MTIDSIIHKFIIEDNILQTLSNLLFIATLIIGLINFLFVLFSTKRSNVNAFQHMLYTVVCASVAVMFNKREMLFKNVDYHWIGIGLVAIIFIFSLLKIVKITFTKIKIHNQNKESQVVRKTPSVMLAVITSIGNCLLPMAIIPLSKGFQSVYNYLANIPLGEFILPPVSIYTIILFFSLLIVFVINEIIDLI